MPWWPLTYAKKNTLNKMQTDYDTNPHALSCGTCIAQVLHLKQEGRESVVRSSQMQTIEEAEVSSSRYNFGNYLPVMREDGESSDR